MNKKYLDKLARDLYHNSTLSYNEVSGQDAMRNLIRDTLQIDENATAGERYAAFQKNKYDLYAVMNIAIGSILPNVVAEQFDQLANQHVIPAGDKVRLDVESPELFRVARIAAGTQDLRRQEIVNQYYTIETDKYGVSVYTELDRFLAGQVDWAGYIDRVALSFVNHIGLMIYRGIQASYDALRDSRKATGTLDAETLLELARHVRAASGEQRVSVYGSLTTLSKLAAKEGTNLLLSDDHKNEFQQMGYIGTVRGLDLIALPEVYEANTSDFAIDEDTLLLVPGDARIVDVVLEGEPLTIDIAPEDRNDLQLGYTTIQNLGVGVRQSSVYALYEVSE